MQSVPLVVCWLDPYKHLLKETFQEARDLPTHTYLSLLVPSIQFLKLPLDFIDQANTLSWHSCLCRLRSMKPCASSSDRADSCLFLTLRW